MDSTEARAQQEVAQVVRIVEELTGLPSRWSGWVELMPEPDYKGAKSFSCHIFLAAAIVDQDKRWMTLIHEALHCVSVGFVRNDYEQAPGWEEGVLEQMQRLLRPRVLARLSVSVPPQVLADADLSHSFNRSIVALEEIRKAVQAERMSFYLRLLRTPIKDRIGAVLAEMRALSGDKRSEFVRVFAKSNAMLKEKLQWIE